MDGVIFDTERFFLQCCVPAAESLGMQGMEEVALKCIGLTEEETARVVVSHYGEEAPLEEYREETFRIFREKYEKEGRVLIVAPDDIGDMDTLTKDHEALEQMYAKGLTDARAIPEFLSH